mmetsp:Transcript_67272/g.169775  ORF Transcript_67272/g.169775 Transcript_67272/m.169775 type:complete len:341 (+) Transcript_67272:94-1116(+)
MADREAELTADRESSALKKLQAAAGFVDKAHAERLDWMYEQSALQLQPDQDKLMNMPVDAQKDKDLEDVKKLQESTAGSLFLKSATKTTEDMLRKLREDPLFQIRRQEQAARENMMANPLVMAKLQKKAAKQSKKEEKKAKKAAKKQKKAMKKLAKKEAKASGKKKKSSSSSSSSSSAAPAGARGALQRSPPRRRSRSRSPHGQSAGRVAEQVLGPAGVMVSAREERAQLIAQRKDAALASRGAPRRMDEEEKRRRLEQMSQDARTHERSKDARIASADQREREIEDLEKKMRQNSDQKFFREMREKAYMGDEGASVAERLRNQRHRRQKHINDPLERDN